MYLGTIGTRQCAIAQLVRKIPSQAQHLIFVSEAGPCGSWLYRYLTKKAYDCWAVAPSLLPQKPGDRVTTDRWKAVQLARLARSGDRTAVDVPKIDGEAMRALTRARADTSSAQKDAQLRLKACVLRHEMRSGGRANGARPPCGGSLKCFVLPQRRTACYTPTSARFRHSPHASSVSHRHGTRTATPGVCLPSSRPSRPCVGCRALALCPWERQGAPGHGVTAHAPGCRGGACCPRHMPPVRNGGRAP
jgi:hypothetical protein